MSWVTCSFDGNVTFFHPVLSLHLVFQEHILPQLELSDFSHRGNIVQYGRDPYDPSWGPWASINTGTRLEMQSPRPLPGRPNQSLRFNKAPGDLCAHSSLINCVTERCFHRKMCPAVQ